MKRVNGEKCFLSKLKTGQMAKVIDVLTDKKELKMHLLEIGIIKDTIVIIKKRAPLEDPIVIELRGYELCLRKNELNKIYVEVLQ